MGGLCRSQSDLAKECADKLCPLVLHHLDDSDPVVCGPLWQAVLYTVSTVTQCWQVVNVQAAVLPALWSLLKSGGAGNAAVIYPNLLPFLSKLPLTVTGDETVFYPKYFDAMKTG